MDELSGKRERLSKFARALAAMNGRVSRRLLSVLFSQKEKNFVFEQMISYWLSGKYPESETFASEEQTFPRTVDFSIRREILHESPIYIRIRLGRLRHVTKCEAEFECDKATIRKAVFERLNLLDGTKEEYEVIDMLGELLFDLIVVQ